MSKYDRVIEVYRRLPELECKGLCWETCGPIPIYAVEAKNIKDKYGSMPMVRESDATQTCTMLTADKKCSIYEDRPLICRLYGVAGGMKCAWGCKPIEGRISDAQAHKLLRALAEIDGARAEVLVNED